VYDLVVAGGWLMLPILLCSLVSVAIVIERFWSLNRRKILPAGLLKNAWEMHQAGPLSPERIAALRNQSPLGEVFAAGLVNQAHGRETMKDAMEEAGSKVVHDMECFLPALGTIAAVAPLLGLLGTVLGMIEVFSEIMLSGTGDTARLAGGISTALITTAAGLVVAIPSMIFHRYFERQVDDLAAHLQHQSSRLLDALFSGKALHESLDAPDAEVEAETDSAPSDINDTETDPAAAPVLATPAADRR